MALTLLILAAASADGQDLPNAHRLGVSGGLSHVGTQDRTASSTVYSGQATPVAVAYRFDGERNRHRARLTFASGTLQALTRDGPGLDLDHARLDAHYGYLRQVAGHSRAAAVFVGGYWANQIGLNGYPAGGTYWTGLSSIDASAALTLSMGGRHRLEARIRVPVAAYVLRPPYSVDSDELYRAYYDNSRFLTDLGSVAAWGDLAHVSAGLRYDRDLTPWLGAELDYAFGYTHYREPRPTSSASHSVSVGVNLLF